MDIRNFYGRLCLYFQPIGRSSLQRCSIKKGVVRNFTKFTGKHLCLSLFFIKAAGLRPATLLKKRLWHGCFPVNFVKFLRTPFFHRTPLVAASVSHLYLLYLWTTASQDKMFRAKDKAMVDVLINLRLNIESCFLTETTLLQSYICVINYCRNYYLLAAYKFLSNGSLRNNILEFRIYFEK